MQSVPQYPSAVSLNSPLVKMQQCTQQSDATGNQHTSPEFPITKAAMGKVSVALFPPRKDGRGEKLNQCREYASEALDAGISPAEIARYLRYKARQDKALFPFAAGEIWRLGLSGQQFRQFLTTVEKVRITGEEAAKRLLSCETEEDGKPVPPNNLSQSFSRKKDWLEGTEKVVDLEEKNSTIHLVPLIYFPDKTDEQLRRLSIRRLAVGPSSLSIEDYI